VNETRIYAPNTADAGVTPKISKNGAIKIDGIGPCRVVSISAIYVDIFCLNGRYSI
jgi:hypothetical protein